MIPLPLAAVALACTPVATDGDTIRCGDERIRLTAIDAPEMPGHCAKGRDCAPGDPYASRDALARELTAGPVTIVRLGKDHWGRTVGDILVNGKSASCAHLAGGYARYWVRYDAGARVKHECGL